MSWCLLVMLSESDPSTDFNTPQKRHRTQYMMQVDRSRLRRLILSGLSLKEAADQLGMSVDNADRYLEAIRAHDYEVLAKQDNKTRALAIQSARESFEDLRQKMLDIINSPATHNRDKVAAAAMARQFEMDLVNLTLNGPLAAGIVNRHVIRLPSGAIQETEGLTASTDITTDADRPTESDDSQVI